jgi:ABC-type uncharacterized transport system involved in gliding motility auxiliary subunit
MTGLPALLAALGLVGVSFALLSFLIVLFSGAGLASDLGWIGGNLTVGIVLLVSAAALNLDALRDRMSSGEARRASKYGTSAILATLLSIAILGMLGFLGTRYHKRFDWTEQQIHTLSDQTQKVLEGLETDVEALALVSKLDEAPVRELLDRYAYASERFVVEYADPNVRPGLLEQHGIDPQKLGRGLVRIAIGGDAVEVTEIDESSVTNAMVKLTRTGEKVVYFLEGHGEKAVLGEAGEVRDGFTRAAEALRNENYRVETLLLASVGEVPEDADVVIIAGPTRALLDVEYEGLERYLLRGGAVMALVDPRVRTDLVDRLAMWGATLGDDVIVDRTLALFGRAMTPFAGSYDPDHEITREMKDAALFHDVRSVSGSGDFTEIVFTGDRSWAERDLERLDSEGAAAQEDDDLAGPVPVAVAGTPVLSSNGGEPGEAGEGASQARLAVYGDADFASNEFIEAYANRDLFVNTVNWLIGDVEAIAIRPNRSRASRFQLSSEQFRTIRSLSLFVLPELIAVIGVFTWWSRRNPGG